MLHLSSTPMRRPFTDWLATVDRLLVKRVGLDSGSLEDWPWNADYDCGLSPQEAVTDWLAENMPDRGSIWL